MQKATHVRLIKKNMHAHISRRLAPVVEEKSFVKKNNQAIKFNQCMPTTWMLSSQEKACSIQNCSVLVLVLGFAWF